MATSVVQAHESEKTTFSQKINEFLTKNRVVLLSVLIAFVVFFVGLVIYTLITDAKNNAAYSTVETAFDDWEKARSATDKTGLVAQEDTLIVTLQKVAASNKKSYAGARANMTIAEIYFSRKDWKNAQDSYLLAANAAPEAYTSGLAWFNAGVCADELGNNDQAFEFFNKALALDGFNLKARVLFNIGRIEEQRANTDAAIASYQKIAEQFPNDDWTSLAKSRIIALQLK